jgi:hypothetical protein
MPPVGLEPMIPAGERPKTYDLDRTATGTGDNGNLECTNIRATSRDTASYQAFYAKVSRLIQNLGKDEHMEKTTHVSPRQVYNT